MQALELFNQGKLDEAIQQATAQVRQDPAAIGPRVMLAELLCFQGEFERADHQLEAASDLEPGAAVGIAQLRQIVHAEVARQEFHSTGRVPEFLADPTEELKLRLRAAVALRAGDPAAAVKDLADAEKLRATVTGECDGARFTGWRDADDLLGSVLEVLTGDGRYFWVPIDQVESLSLEAPARPRDLLFRTTLINVRGGPEGQVFLPTLYAGTTRADDAGVRLGRATDWTGGDDTPTRGIGQRLFLIGDDGKALMDITSVSLDAPPASGAEQQK